MSLALANHLLISTADSGGGIFQNSVIYVCQHDKDGAFGIVINKPSKLLACELLKKLKAHDNSADKNPVLRGGPVKPDQVFVLHSPAVSYDVTIQSGGDIAVTLSQDILVAAREGRAPQKILYAYGYTGWESGQLEEEVQNNAWITLQASPKIVFDTPHHTRFAAAGRMLGFDVNNLSQIKGNA